jgi:hypothetical protein
MDYLAVKRTDKTRLSGGALFQRWQNGKRQGSGKGSFLKIVIKKQKIGTLFDV